MQGVLDLREFCVHGRSHDLNFHGSKNPFKSKLAFCSYFLKICSISIFLNIGPVLCVPLNLLCMMGDTALIAPVCKSHSLSI